MDGQPIKHVCGVCHDEWLTEAEYLNHVCPHTNATPQDPQHLINSTTPDFAAISQAALERGAADTNNDVVTTEQPNTDVVATPTPEQPADNVTITGATDTPAPTINLG